MWVWQQVKDGINLTASVLIVVWLMQTWLGPAIDQTWYDSKIERSVKAWHQAHRDWTDVSGVPAKLTSVNTDASGTGTLRLEFKLLSEREGKTIARQLRVTQVFKEEGDTVYVRVAEVPLNKQHQVDIIANRDWTTDPDLFVTVYSEEDWKRYGSRTDL